MIREIIFSLWFMLPAACANVAPIIAAKLPGLRRWRTPIDFNRQYRGVAIFGPHKTWRGIVTGMVVATVVLWMQQFLVIDSGWLQNNTIHYLNYETVSIFILGPLLALGALGGDALESMLKRRRGIPSGKSWLPFDQLDYIIGAIIVTLPIVLLPWRLYAWMVVIWFGIHLLTSYVGWRLHLKDAPI